MNTKVKVMVLNSLILSLVRYAMPLLINLNCKQVKVVKTLVLKVARVAIGYHSYYWTNTKVLKTREWLDGIHLLYYSIISFVHKCNFDRLPKLIVDNWVYTNRDGKSRLIGPRHHSYKPKSSITSNSLLHKGIFIYSKVQDSMKTKNGKTFKKYIRNIIQNKFPNDRMILPSDYG